MSDSSLSKPIYFISIVALIIALAAVYFSKSRQVVVSSLSEEQFIEKRTTKSFQNAAEDAEFAISERNFRITNTLRIGNAVKERGNKDFPENNVILFCNIQYAEKMLSLNTDYVNFCPGQIAVREEGEQVIISAPLVPLTNQNDELDKLVNEVNKLVIESVEFAAEDWQEVYD